MSISTKMYEIYLGFVAPEDIFAYSVDEVFIDATPYLSVLRCTARELAMRMIREVLRQTGITATAGIGTNLYLCKIAMDIMAKKMPSDADGVRIAELTELSYRENLWEHRPLTSFWRVGAGIAAKLESHGMFTMGDVARCSLVNEELLYRLFGVNAELLIDHAWGYEPCLLSDVKAYKPETNSVSMGQVLNCPYTWEKARLIVREMVDLLALDLVDKGLVTDSLVLDIGYDTENLADPALCRSHTGEIVTDAYGRKLPKHAHGTARLPFYNASTMRLTDAAMTLFDRITEPRFTVRRMSITACHVISEGDARMRESVDGEQMDLFTDYDSLLKKQEAERASLLRERAAQDAILSLRRRYGKNAVLRGINYLDGATMRERNRQIGGHRM